jgi:hypothetical protein
MVVDLHAAPYNIIVSSVYNPDFIKWNVLTFIVLKNLAVASWSVGCLSDEAEDGANNGGQDLAWQTNILPQIKISVENGRKRKRGECQRVMI